MERPLRVLIVDASEKDALLLIEELQRGGYDTRYNRVQTAQEMTVVLNRLSWDIDISDYDVPQFNRKDALNLVRGQGLDVPFVFVSAASVRML